MDERISIRKAEFGDRRFLYELRNDSAVVDASLSGRGVDWQVHTLWFDAKLAEGASMFVVEIDDKPAGYIRFDPIQEEFGGFEVAVGFQHHYRNRGLGRRAISLGSRLVEAMGAKKLTAIIKSENAPSIKAFEAAGYHLDSQHPRLKNNAGADFLRYTRESPRAAGRENEENLYGRCGVVASMESQALGIPPCRFLLIADFGGSAGFGHLRRMAALGEAIASLGSAYAIATRSDRGLAEADGSKAAENPEEPLHDLLVGRPLLDFDDLYWCRDAFDAAVMDSYRATSEQARIANATAALADGAPPPVSAPIIVDPSPGARKETYSGLAETTFAGGQYALLTFPFWDALPEPPAYPPQKILVNLGSAAERSFCDAVVESVRDAAPKSDIHVTARGTPPKEYFSSLCSADLVVTAGGVSSLEVARLGRPAVGVVLSPNQRQNIEGLARCGALVAADPTPADIAREVAAVVGDEALFRSLAKAGPRTIDGRGACRVATALVDYVQARKQRPNEAVE
jgi:spore coat polysaccharide biosynthesis predicted glycosyltransferase SpsG/RimJ/RimL family protein N-acetyltransferase